jgi:flagellar protein FliO/FliZ
MKFTVVILSVLLCLPTWAAEITADEKSSDEAIEAAANQLIAEGGTIDVKKSEEVKADSSTEVETKAASVDLKESEIPVVVEDKKIEKSENNFVWRLGASLGILLIVAGVATYAGKKWRHKKNVGGQKARIEIMHQLHLGPKKSIGLIRVAGETFLVGITDQNINMLKSVTLIDDELENIVGKTFNNFLEDEFSIEDVRTALGPRA